MRDGKLGLTVDATDRRNRPITRPGALIAAVSVMWLLAAVPRSPAAAQAAPDLPQLEGKTAALLRFQEAELARLQALGQWPPDHYPPADPDPSYDVRHYEIRLRLDPVQRSFHGRTQIDVVILHAGLDSLRLDYCGPAITSVTDGSTPLAYAWNGERLSLPLTPPPAAGAFISVVVEYGGTTDRGVYFARPPIPGLPDSPAIFTFSEPEDARFWFPCHDVPDDKATADVFVTVPDGYLGASNGRLVEEAAAGPGLRLFHWRETDPIATYLICAVAGPYAVIRDDRLPGIPIVHYVYKPDSAAAVVSFQNVPEMIRHFSDLFGPYPFVKYGHAEAAFPGGMEHQTLTLIRDVETRSGVSAEPLIAHELAHQWWGDSVTLKDWRHIWLNEGFASYGDALWREHVMGPDSLRTRMELFGRLFRFVYITRNIADPVVNPPGKQLFGTTVYNKGAWVLHMLRHILGDDTFFRILRQYHATYRFGNATTDDFIAVCESVYGDSLGWYFRPWLHVPGLPRYQLDWRAEPTSGGRSLIRVTVAQAQASPFYPMPVDFAFHTTRGQEMRTVFLDRNPQTFTVLVEGAPVDSGVVLDPGGWILKTVERKAMEPVEAPPSRLVGLAPVHATGAPPLEIEASLSPGDPISLRADIFDVRGRLVAVPYDGPAGSGTTRIRWDGLDRQGRRSGSGVFFIRAAAAGEVRVLRLVMVR